MPRQKADQVVVIEFAKTNTVQIHVTGDMVPNSVYLKILEHMQVYRDLMTIIFVVYDAKMMLLIRQSIPSEFYERIELCGQKEGLQSAG